MYDSTTGSKEQRKALTEDSILPPVLNVTCRYNAVYKPKYKYSVHQYDKSIGLYH